MRKILLTLLAVLFALPATDALAKRKQVRINKPSQPIAQPLAAVPVFGIAFDLVRRTTCDPRLAVGGGPGFDPEPKTGNFLIPATAGRCATRPQPKRG